MIYETIEIYNTEDITSIEIINSEDIVTIEISELGSPGINGIGVPVGGTTGQVLSKIDNTDFNTHWIDTPISETNLSYEATSTNGIITSSTGTGAVIPLATDVNAGLFSPDEKSNLSQQSGINTGDQDLSGFATTSELDLKANTTDVVPYTGATSEVDLGANGITASNYTVNGYTGNRLLLDNGNLLEPNFNLDTRFLSTTGSGEPTGNTPVWELLTKSSVGLSNVDNTSDANKPVSTATQNALDLKVDNNNIVQNTLVYANTNDSITEFPNNTGSSLLFLASSDGSLPSWQPVPVSGSLVYYYSNTASDVVGYYKQQIDPISTLETIQNIDVIDGQLLASWITEPNNPALTNIQAGQYACHVHIAKISGTKSSQIRAEIWEANELGVDIGKIADLGASSVISGTNAEYIIADSILEYTLASAKSRISTKIYAVITGGGSAPHLNIYLGDGSDSRTDFPSPSISASNFLPYNGAVKDVDLGTYSITANSFNGNSTTQSQGDNSNKIATTSYVDTGLNLKLGYSFEAVSKNLKSLNYLFNYAGQILSNIVYDTPSGDITKTFNYTGNKLTSIVFSGATPLGISLTKTFIYSGDTLTNIIYS